MVDLRAKIREKRTSMERRITQEVKLSWGKKGEYLVIFQFILMIFFVFLPAVPCVDAGLLRAMAPFRWFILACTWAAALLLGASGSRQLRKFLTPLPYPVDHNQLVTSGAYALVRHPLYSSLLLAATGWTLFTMSLAHLFLTLFGFIFFSYKASREERWLTERHPEYADYARRVKRFIPWLF